MKIRVAVAVPAVAYALTCAAEAAAAGIALDVQSARGTGMAGSVTAMIDDSSSIFYNPAGIAQGKIIDAQIGDSLVIPSYKYTSPAHVSTSNSLSVVPPFQAYESGGITDDLSVGVGVFTPFGLTLSWPPDWQGRNVIVKSSFMSFDFNPTVAYRFGPLRIGAGLQLVRGTVDLQRKVRAPGAELSTELGAATWGVGANVGAQLEAIPQYLSLGVHYRSAVTFNFDGVAHFSDNVPVPLQSTFHDQRVKTSITTPDVLQMGIATRPVKDLVLDLDLVWYGWSKFRSIDINFPNDASGLLGTSQPKNWSNTVNVHVGGEGIIDESWRVRAGVLYDPTPSPDSTLRPDVPDSDRINLAVGGSYLHSSGFRVDLAYQFLVVLKKTSTAQELPGDYSGFVNIIGISLGYRSPRPRYSHDG